MIVWVGGGIALSLSTTIQDIHGFSFSRPKMRLKGPLYHLPKKLNVNINVRLWLFEVTMVPSSRNYTMDEFLSDDRGSNINIPRPILLNKMVLQRGRIR